MGRVWEDPRHHKAGESTINAHSASLFCTFLYHVALTEQDMLTTATDHAARKDTNKRCNYTNALHTDFAAAPCQHWTAIALWNGSLLFSSFQRHTTGITEAISTRRATHTQSRMAGCQNMFSEIHATAAVGTLHPGLF